MILQKFTQNLNGRDFVIGDLHGHYDTLMKKLEEISFDYERDRLFSVGDIIDRGPDSFKCLDLIFEPWFHSVRGNHEQMMIDVVVCDDPIDNIWFSNGGDWAKEYAAEVTLGYENRPSYFWKKDFKELVEIIDDLLPLAIEIETNGGSVGIVHGNPPNIWNKALISGQRLSILWSGHKLNTGNTQLIPDIDQIYVGHMNVPKPKELGNVMYIDTGCGYNDGYLTMKQICSQKKKRQCK